MKISSFILEAILLISVFAIGYLANDSVRYLTNKRAIDGLMIFDRTEEEAKQIQHEYDEQGDWIAVNIRGMTMERAFDVCKHETGHEIFAEYCEDNFEKCINMTKDIEASK